MNTRCLLLLCLLSFWSPNNFPQAAATPDNDNFLSSSEECEYPSKDDSLWNQLDKDEREALEELDHLFETMDPDDLKVTYRDPSWLEIQVQKMLSRIAEIPYAVEIFVKIKEAISNLRASPCNECGGFTGSGAHAEPIQIHDDAKDEL